MLEGKTFLGATGMPIRKIALVRTRLEDWLPEPLTVAAWMVRSLTTRAVVDMFAALLPRNGPTEGAPRTHAGRRERAVVRAPSGSSGHPVWRVVLRPSLRACGSDSPDSRRTYVRRPTPYDAAVGSRQRACNTAWAAPAASLP